VALENWTFSLTFDGSTPEMQQLRNSKEALLKLGGVDTFGTVKLNGNPLLETNNFHRHWTVSVKNFLVPGENTLTITIIPAMYESLRLRKDHPYSIPMIHQMGSVGAYTFVRKPASDLGWDWGPGGH
jgi:beta-mannosidase